MDRVLQSFNDYLQDPLLLNLILQRLPQFGPVSHSALLDHFDTPATIFSAKQKSLKPFLNDDALQIMSAIKKQGASHPIVQQAQQDIAWCKNNNTTILLQNDARYPALLKEIPQAPPVLFVRGNINNLVLPQIAIVGSRNATPTGLNCATQFAKQLTAMGFAITSGLALGIDAAAHAGALQSQAPTIAVMGTGVDKIYPYRNRQLAENILSQNGTLISEFPLSTTPQASHFPRRNRIISGLCMGVLVVEAALKSGSLITARYALQHNREVFAIPGSIHNPLSRGCHALIREGATLTESIDDMCESLQGLLQWQKEALHNAQNKLQNKEFGSEPENLHHLTTDEKAVLKHLTFDTSTLDQIQQRSGKESGQLLSLLVSLEFKGAVFQTAGGYQRVGQNVGRLQSEIAG